MEKRDCEWAFYWRVLVSWLAKLVQVLNRDGARKEHEEEQKLPNKLLPTNVERFCEYIHKYILSSIPMLSFRSLHLFTDFSVPLSLHPSLVNYIVLFDNIYIDT